MKGAIKDQDEISRASLELLQVNANKAALEEMCQEQKNKIERAQAEWQDSEWACCRFRTTMVA